MGKTSRKNTGWFIEKAKLIHGDKYDYSKVEYINRRTNVLIMCPIHGEFYQNPKSHLNGHGCVECARIKSTYLKSNTNDFIEKARKVHGDIYDYSKVEYVDRKTKVTIICPIHGEFLQIPYSHLRGAGCIKCKNNKISNSRKNKNISLSCKCLNDLQIGEYNKKSYQHWRGMLTRCYGVGTNISAYKDCYVCDEWLVFSNFNSWFNEHYVEGWHLDKDILVKGNKVYSPNTCCFVPKEINSMFSRKNKGKNGLPNGVHLNDSKKKFISLISVGGKQKHLGTFESIEEAFNTYKQAKEAWIQRVANKYQDKLHPKVFNAMMNYDVSVND